MKLALLAARLPPANDGVGDHADMLARALVAGGHDVTVIAAGEVTPPSGYALELTGNRWGPAATARAIATLRSSRPDALVVEYTPFLYGSLSSTPLVVLLAARAFGIRSVAIVHEAFHASGSPAARSAWKAGAFAARDAATLANAAVIAVTSDARAAALALRLPGVRDRIAVVPIGANVEPPPGYRWDPRLPATIVAFGVVMPRRRLEHAVAAVAQLVANGADVRLDIIGRIHDAAYAARIAGSAADAGIGERVRFRGELPPAEISALLAGAAAAVHAPFEGAVASSGSLLALLAHGVPTVALRTRFDDGVFAGALHYAGDDRELAAALHALTSEPQSARGLAAAAAACYRTNFAWPAVAERLEHVLQMGAADARLVPA